MKKTKLKITACSASGKKYINDKIDEFNAKQIPLLQKKTYINLSYSLKDEGGQIVGGISAVLYCWNCLYIDVLWLEEEYRYLGYGSELIKKVETEAVKQGCHLAHLDTFDFQAKDFYLKHGYEIFGVLDNCPVGHQRFYLRKNLDVR